MRKKWIRGCCILLIAALLTGVLSGCGEKSEIGDLLSRFESACQELDVRAVLECVDPAISSPVLTVLDLAGVEDTSGTLDLLVSTLSIFGNVGTGTEEFMRSLTIEPEDYEFDSKKESCQVSGKFQYGNGDSPRTMDVIIRCVKVDDQWYVSGIQ